MGNVLRLAALVIVGALAMSGRLDLVTAGIVLVLAFFGLPGIVAIVGGIFSIAGDTQA